MNEHLLDREMVIEKLLSRRLIDPVTGCWLWTGAKHGKQFTYGTLTIKRRKYTTHRLSLYAFHKLDLTDPSVCSTHRCDNPPCFNPEHLKPGTQADNTADMIAKGRQRHDSNPVGEAHGLAVLTTEKVLLIRRLRVEGVKLNDIARIAEVKRGTIPDILAGRTWSHV